jgi:hypothetical protein
MMNDDVTVCLGDFADGGWPYFVARSEALAIDGSASAVELVQGRASQEPNEREEKQKTYTHSAKRAVLAAANQPGGEPPAAL